MNAAGDERGNRRGAELLLAHCSALQDGAASPRSTLARARLERELGGRLARLLLRALAGDYRTPSRVLGL